MQVDPRSKVEPSSTGDTPSSSSHMRVWLEGWAASPWSVGTLLVLTALLFLPSLSIGFLYDTFFVAALEAPTSLQAWAAPYVMTFETEAARAFWSSRGVYFWWADEGFRWTLMRPLSTWLLHQQWQAFGASVLGYHLLSLGGYLLVVWAAWRLYRRVLSRGTALLALALFATHFGHMQTVWLIVNQHSILSVLPALLGLVAYLRWREDGWHPGLPLWLLGLGAGLSAGETALAMAGYVGAYELLAGPGPLHRRLLCLLPTAAAVLVYVAIHHALGYTSRGSFVYLDPAHEPGAFVTAALSRFPALVAGLWNVVPADFYNTPTLRPLQWIGMGVLGLQLPYLLRIAWQGLTLAEQKALKWVSLGAFLSLIPGTAALPGGRLLLCASLGSSLVVALLLRHGLSLLKREASQSGRRTYLLALAPLALMNGVIMPGVMPLQLLQMQSVSRSVETSYQTAVIEDSRLETQELVVLTAPGMMTALNFLSGRHLMHGGPLPQAYWVLSCEPYAHRVTRVAPNVLEVEVVGGHFIGEGLQATFKPRKWPLEAGDTIDQGTLQVQIVAVGANGHPTRVRFQFRNDLDSQHYQVLSWIDGSLQPVTLPPVGGSMELPLSASPYGAWL